MSAATDTEDHIQMINIVTGICLDIAKQVYKCIEINRTRLKIGYTDAKKKYNEAMKKYQEDKAAYDQDLKAYKTVYDSNPGQYGIDRTAYNTDMVTYNADMVTYNMDMKTYNTDMVTYNTAMETYYAGSLTARPEKPIKPTEPVKPIKPVKEKPKEPVEPVKPVDPTKDDEHAHILDMFQDKLNVAAFITDNGIVALSNTILSFAAVTAEASIKLRYNGDVVISGAGLVTSSPTKTKAEGPSANIKYAAKMAKVGTGLVDFSTSFATQVQGIQKQIQKNSGFSVEAL